MKLTSKQIAVLDAEGHLLVTGGPGSGKTTISILKAAKIASFSLRPGQRLLFLSFARATVSRVIEAIEHERSVQPEHKKLVDVDTYHAFFWRLISTHGYLLGLPRKLEILTPSAEGIALSAIRETYQGKAKLTDVQKAERSAREQDERLRLAQTEGKICFSLFAHYAAALLEGSARIRGLVATMYPVIVLDEFQDTNGEQWRVVKALGQVCTLIALADPEQRIYDWIGADPERLDHFKAAFTTTEIDLSQDNHRSAGTDIALFGNDILKGHFSKESYVGIEFELFEPYEAQAMTTLITTIYAARKRLTDAAVKNWSLAVLVPTKRMTRLVSDALRAPPAQLAPISHAATIELEGAILAAELIAFLLQPDVDGHHFERFVDLLCAYFYGRGGDAPTKGDLSEARAIRKACDELLARNAAGQPARKNSIIVATRRTYEAARHVTLTGDPDGDWRAITRILKEGECTRLRGLADEARNIRLLDRGTQLRQELSQDWRDYGTYANALAIIKRSFVQEHFSTSSRPETGVVVMNMHKAKGKQFDEVLIFEGWPRYAKGQIVANLDRIVRGNEREQVNDQARQNLRVSVTRGKKRTTIITPSGDPCVLLVPES